MASKIKTLVLRLLAVAAIVMFMGGLWVFALEHHERSGECGGASGCGWAWCRYYDGRDFLHD